MNSTKTYFLVTLGVLVAATVGSAQLVNADPVPIGNSSFEVPDLPNGGFEYGPAGATWSFTGGGGISDPPSGFGDTPAPDGNQYAYLQSESSFFQAITVPSDGTYVLTLFAAGRPQIIAASGNQAYRVLLDSDVIFNGSTTTGSAFIAEESAPFLATAGAHTLTFEGLNDFATFGDQTAFIDAVAINSVDIVAPVPAGSSIVLLGLGAAALAAMRRNSVRRRAI